MTMYGTAHFSSPIAARKYYRSYLGPSSTAADVTAYVRGLLDNGSIKLGAPSVKPDEVLHIDADGRYWRVVL